MVFVHVWSESTCLIAGRSLTCDPERRAFVVQRDTAMLAPLHWRGLMVSMEENPYKAPTDSARRPKRQERDSSLGLLAIIVGTCLALPMVPKLVAWLCTIGLM